MASLSPIVSLPQPVTLDIDAWSRQDDAARGYAYAVPPGWTVDARDPDLIRIGRSDKERAQAPDQGEGLVIQTVPVAARQEISNLVAADFSGQRLVRYDVSIDGRSAVFAVAFENDRIRRQALYVPQGSSALVVRSATADPSVFSALVSTLKFYSADTTKKDTL